MTCLPRNHASIVMKICFAKVLKENFSSLFINHNSYVLSSEFVDLNGCVVKFIHAYMSIWYKAQLGNSLFDEGPAAFKAHKTHNHKNIIYDLIIIIWNIDML